MKAVVFENQKISIADVPVPDPSEQEALVRIDLAGICATDFELLKGYHNFTGIPGHEFVGTVFSAPGHPEFVGRRVVADINCGCGVCDICLKGNYRHCVNRTVIGIRNRNGVFAEYCTIPLSNLYMVPDSIDNDEAVFAEPLAAALEIIRQVEVTEDLRIAVLGDGRIGLLCSLVLRQYSSATILIGRHQHKLDIAAQQGVHSIFRSDSGSGKISPVHANAFDLVVEATGSPGGINDACRLVRPEGTVVIKTTAHKKSEIDLAAVVVNELRLLGSRCGNIARAIDFLGKKVIDFRPMIEAVYPLDKFKEAFDHAGKKGSLKVLIANELK